MCLEMSVVFLLTLRWQFVGREASSLEIISPRDFEITAPLPDDADSLPALCDLFPF